MEDPNRAYCWCCKALGLCQRELAKKTFNDSESAHGHIPLLAAESVQSLRGGRENRNQKSQSKQATCNWERQKQLPGRSQSSVVPGVLLADRPQPFQPRRTKRLDPTEPEHTAPVWSERSEQGEPQILLFGRQSKTKTQRGRIASGWTGILSFWNITPQRDFFPSAPQSFVQSKMKLYFVTVPNLNPK